MNDRFVRTGVFLAPFYAVTENPLLCLELMHLDRLNDHQAWIGEHHSGGFEIIACPELFIAAAAECTRHVRVSTGVVSLPYHNHFTVADRASGTAELNQRRRSHRTLASSVVKPSSLPQLRTQGGHHEEIAISL